MKVDFNSNNNQNFGMALYMPKKSNIAKQVGPYLADVAEEARPALKKLVENVDIYVSPRLHKDLKLKGFDIKISKVITNPIKRALGLFEYVDDSICNYQTGAGESMFKLLIERPAELKDKFLFYSGR